MGKPFWRCETAEILWCGSLEFVLNFQYFVFINSKHFIFFCFTLVKLLYFCFVNTNMKYRKVTFFKNYFQDFFDKQNLKVKSKIVWTFELIEDLQRVPETYLKHLENTDGLYEIRVQVASDIFRFSVFLMKVK